jgi:hypothetical protein
MPVPSLPPIGVVPRQVPVGKDGALTMLPLNAKDKLPGRVQRRHLSKRRSALRTARGPRRHT